MSVEVKLLGAHQDGSLSLRLRVPQFMDDHWKPSPDDLAELDDALFNEWLPAVGKAIQVGPLLMVVKSVEQVKGG